MRVLLLAALLTVPLAAGDGAAAQAPTTQASKDPDVLYAARENLPNALEAARLWEARLGANPRDFEAAWKLARACYWLGGHVAADEQRAQYERGIAAAQKAVDLDAMRPEGHFWMAASMGAMAESFGLRAGLRYRGTIKRELETVLMLDPAFQDGSADRALGRWYLNVPAQFGCSKTKSVQHLRKSLTYIPASTASHYFLAETLFEMDRDEEARRELQKVLDAPVERDFGPESLEFKQKARTRLASAR